MITDFHTNTVYLSAWTRTDFPDMTDRLVTFFTEHGIQYDFLKGSQDHYCRDYMPIQVSKDKYVQFVFRPTAYFKPYEYKHISNPVRIELENALPQPVYSRIILDGGNVVKGKDKVIITDKVIDDNQYQMPPNRIIDELETLLEAKVILIPALKSDRTGHADGMIRFISENKVLINQLDFEEEPEWEDQFLKALNHHHLESVQIPVFEDKPDSGVGIYINYLHVGNLIVIPFFDHHEEQNSEALRLMKDYFTDYTIESVDATELANHGGVLNCATWNILR